MKNVRVIDACCISVITDSLVKVIQAEKLVERCTWEIHSRKSAVDIQEAVGSPGGIDIEAVGIAPVVDSDDLRLGGCGEILNVSSGKLIVWK